MDLPPYMTFLDAKNMDYFWSLMKWMLFLVAPFLMIWVAVELVGRLTGVVKESVDTEKREKRSRRDEDEEDYYY